MRTGRLLALAMGLTLVGWSAGARAQDNAPATQRATARTLFEEGLALLRAERWQDAATRFEKARALHPSPNITYNLTTALVRLGRLVEASEMLRDLGRDPGAPADVRAAGESRLAEIVPRIASLELQISGDTEGIAIALDGKPLTSTLLGVPIAVDPRPLELTIRRDGAVIEARTIDVGEGRRERVSIVLPVRDQAPVVARPAATEKPPGPVDLTASAGPAAAEPDSSRWLWIGAGAAIAVAAVVLFLLVPHPTDSPGVDGDDGNFHIGKN